MTWSRFDDAAPTHPKARAAGNEAWSLWVAAVMYSNRYLTDGYITLAALANDCLPVPIKVAKARKLAEKLCDCRIRPDGHGLLEPIGSDAYQIHDFLKWSPSKTEVENKRERDRIRKRLRAESPTDSESFPRGILTDGRAESESASPARAPAPAGARPPIHSDPIPAQPKPSHAAADDRVPMHPGWQPSAATRRAFEVGLIPAWAIEPLVARFRAHFVSNQDELRTETEWNQSCSKWVFGDWNDPRRRPVKPEREETKADRVRRKAEMDELDPHLHPEIR